MRPMKSPVSSITNEELIATFKKYGSMYVSVKLDGFRGVILGGQALSSTLKPIRNKYTFETMSTPLLEGCDGEYTVGSLTEPGLIQRTSSGITTFAGEPDFRFNIFGNFTYPNAPFYKRYEYAVALANNARHPNVQLVQQILVNHHDDAFAFEEQALLAGYEGMMLAHPEGTYKFGRSTLREAYLLRRKPFEDAECTIIGVLEGEENTNELTYNELGLAKRSSCKDGKVPNGMLGKFVCHDPQWPMTFEIGTIDGVTDEIREYVFNNPDKFIGKTLKYKFQRIGSKDRPRIPIGIWFRDSSDITNY